MIPSDLDLLRAYAYDGDESAFAQLYERHGGWARAAARRRLDDEHLADDATQAIFMILASKAAQLVAEERVSIPAWLFQVMHLTCGRLRRSGARQRRIEADAAKLRQKDRAAGGLSDPQFLAMLEDAICQLPTEERELVVRRFYEGLGFAHIGEMLNISAEAARKRVSRALATVREWMMREGVDAIPDELRAQPQRGLTPPAPDRARAESIAKGALIMMQQIEAIDFAVMTAEFYVADVEANLDFFEKLGFRRHFMDTPDAMGRLPRASLRGGKTARIWLRRASEAEGTRPSPGMTLFFWINGGPEGLIAHRNAIAAQGVAVNPFFDDIGLRNFTVTSPDGYSIGFFTAYK